MEEKKLMREILDLAQNFTGKILDAINPVSQKDLPFIAFSLKSVLRVIEKDMNDEQKLVCEAMNHVIGIEGQTICIKAGTMETFKNFDRQGGGIVNGI